jgi:pimeloyl-ACP methyl ester carboxylesterase
METSVMIESPHGSIEYDESGTGPTVVLVPGSCSTGAVWRPIIARWEKCFRCVTTSLLGYGRTTERRTSGDTNIDYEADILEAVVLRAGGPVHLVGHSFGGLTALAAALRHRVPLLSLVIIEAPAADVLGQAGDHRHCRTIRDMAQAYFSAFESGEEEAIQVMIDFFSGPGTFAAWPERVRNYAIRTTAVNILDWQTAYGFPLSPAMLAKVAVPTLVLRGGESHPAMQRANELLADGIADASLVTLAGAAHFLISTHPDEVAALIALHIDRAEAALPGREDRRASLASFS